MNLKENEKSLIIVIRSLIANLKTISDDYIQITIDLIERIELTTFTYSEQLNTIQYKIETIYEAIDPEFKNDICFLKILLDLFKIFKKSIKSTT